MVFEGYIQKKRRISNKIKGSADEPLGLPPYGYMKNPDGKGWVIDEEVAAVVKIIFDMSIQGYGTSQIALVLEKDKILVPIEYFKSKGIKKPTNKQKNTPFEWNHSTVNKILNTQEYCGDIINFKTYSKSYKNKKRYANNPENIVIFKDANPAIIDRAVFEKIQAKRGKMRKRNTSDGEKNMFSGILVCADCGSNMNYHFNQGNHDIIYFNCSGYNKGKRKICTSTHYICTDFLEQVVLSEIKRLTKFAQKYENEFAELVMGARMKNLETEIAAKEKELHKLEARDKELDILYEKIYEDNAMSKISDERFAKLSSKYEDEQKEIEVKMKELSEEITSRKSKTVTSDMFLKSVRKYTRIKKLSPQILNELIEKIEVFQSEKIDGKTVQKLKIHYNCIGTINIPNLTHIPDNNVKIHTRQGVDVEYSA